MAAEQKLVLHYFPGRGRAELSRLILAEAGVKYEDKRITNWAEVKKSGKYPFEQMPILEVGNVTIAQSIAIARYLAREYGLYGKTNLEGAQADMIIDAIGDLLVAKYKAQTDEEKAKWQNETAPFYLGVFENMLKNNGTGFVVGDSLTYADIALYALFDFLPEQARAKFPLLAGLHKSVAERPRIAEWLKTRPVTEN